MMPFALTLSVLGALSAADAESQEAPPKPPAFAVAARPAPALNHVYVVLDAATFAAVRDSLPLSRLLGRADGGLPDYAPPGPDADRVFFRGRETYLELFAPENRFGEPVGKVGVALGYDAADDLDALEQAWRKSCPVGARRTPVRYRRAAPPVPWYESVQCDETAGGDHLAVWAMVYRPEFHRWQSGTGPTEPPQTSRAHILAPRRAEGQGRFDITHLALQVTPSMFRLLIPQLEGAGFERRETADGTLLTGDGWTLLLRVSEGPPRLLSLDLATDGSPPDRLSLGSSVLVRRGPQTISFRPTEGAD